MTDQFEPAYRTLVPEWVTYHAKPMRRWRLRCALGRHRLPTEPPVPPDGHSPSNYSRCRRCLAAIKWEPRTP